jgi:hypothetical protein
VVEVAAGGLESGPLIVRCGPCNSARSANVTRAFLTMLDPTPPLPAEPNITHTALSTGVDNGPAVA